MSSVISFLLLVYCVKVFSFRYWK